VIGVVVIEWRSSEYLERLLADIRSRSVGVVVIVRHQPRAAAPTSWREHIPDGARLVVEEVPTNPGYAAGINLGVRAAIRAGADALVVCNDDLRLANDCVDLLADSALRMPGGIAGPLTLGSDGTVQTAGVDLDWSSPRIVRHRLTSSAETAPVDSLQGHCLAFSAQTFRRLGPWDEVFFHMWEDTEFCTRLLDARCILVGAAGCEHIGNGAFGSPKTYSAVLEYMLIRNMFRFVSIRGGGRMRLLQLRDQWIDRAGSESFRGGDVGERAVAERVARLAWRDFLDQRFGRWPAEVQCLA
jgi:GT2 family glycosyltransferase